jgi:NADPH:quinone reductase-like Zn-dependent oxidoreductase/acyl carrier protein
LVVASLRRGQPEAAAMRTAAGTLWANGAADLRWGAIAAAAGRRVELPAYPWQRTRYWQTPSAPASTAGRASGLPSSHPLLGARITSPAIAGALHTASVSSSAPAFLSDHRVGATPVFPATGYLELALSALRLPDGASATIADVEFRDAFALRDDELFALQLATTPERDGEFSFEVHAAALECGETTGQWRTLARGRAAGGPVASVSRESLVSSESIDAIRARCSEVVPVDAFYDAATARGIVFGPAFRGVRQLLRGEGEALGEIVLPDEAGSQTPYCVHPALLDACLQVSLAVLAANGADGSSPTPLYLPVGLDTLTIGARLRGPLWSHATARRAADGSTWRVDVVVRSADGSPVARIDGLRVAPVPADRLASLGGHDPLLHRLAWVPAPVRGAAPGIAGRWLVLADPSGMGDAIADALRARGAASVQVLRSGAPDDAASVDTDSSAAVRSAIHNAAATPLAGVIDCWSSSKMNDAPDAIRATTAAMHVAQSMVELPNQCPLWVMTRGAAAIDDEPAPITVAHSAVMGFHLSVELEHPELRVVRIDLDPRSDSIDEIAREVTAEVAVGIGDAGVVALRRGLRFVPSVQHVARSATAPMEPARLERGANGLIEELQVRRAARREPAAGEVEIAIEASGLNFRDVLNALGMYPGEAGPLGSECAGVVVRVGPGVNGIAEGDRVMAFAIGSMATHATVPASWVVKVPRGLTSIQAATLPVAFLTARLGLVELARLQPGERVLIHAGTGGVGMAAIQIAQVLGAEVFATAGTPQKRAILASFGVRHVMDSRSLSFVDDIRSAAPDGVHVVLNALAGDFIPASLGVLALGGRFLEMGKREIWTAQQVARTRPDVTYLPFDLGDAARADATLVPRLFDALERGLRDGTLRPLPVASHSLADAGTAFRAMAQAKHIGKLAVTFPSATRVAPRDNATYLIMGGLGALGLAAARWLADRGARHLMLVSRRGASSNARRVVDDLRSAGVAVTVVAGDVSRSDDVNAILAKIDSSGAALAGVIHTAGVADDGSLVQQTMARAARVLAPKVAGTRALLDAVRGRSLDFIVCYSSMAGVIGSRGQSTYGAANAALDALCHDARQHGVPATAIQWGAWADGGMVSSLSDREAARMSARGILPMSAATALAGLERALIADLPSVIVADVDWERHAASLPATVSSARYAAVHPRRRTQALHAVGSPVADDVFRTRLASALPSQRLGLLTEHVRALALRCLGLTPDTVVDEERPLKDLGLDSLMAVELRNALARSLAITLPATLAFDYPTPRAMAGALLQRTSPSVESPAATPAREFNDARAMIAELSDDEAEALLLKELDAT